MKVKNKKIEIFQSITDLMTSLFVVFLLLLLVYINKNYHDIHKASQNSKQALIYALSKIKINAFNDSKDPLAVIIPIRNDLLLFDKDKSDIKLSGELYLKGFIVKLLNVITQYNFQDDISSIEVDGFTDSDGDDEHNLRLSQDRSYSVLKYILQSGLLTKNNRDYLLGILSTNGQGERFLLPPNSTPGLENKFLSRRVEFKIKLKSYEQKNLISNSLVK